MGYADGLAQGSPFVREAMDAAFVHGLHASCLVIGSLCILGAIAAAIALPGPRFVPLAQRELEPEAPVNVR
ncbi:unannotated protein [freshwater metagenome]|uniref:Unannotated protein n=1 Tax=freshwater metagenome TaxID=449393 RepID=A0A6J6RPM4_9ZZZZ